MSSNGIIEVNSLDELMEMSSMGGGAAQGLAASTPKRKTKMISREKVVSEQLLRKLIKEKLKKELKERLEEKQLRSIIKKMLIEGDLSDVHPNRSTGINTLEDVLKKSIPTLRTDYKRLTTDKKQRESFRSHIVKAVRDSLMPQLVNSSYGIGDEAGSASSLLSEPSANVAGHEEEEFQDLDEADIQIDIDDEDKKIPVEADDEPSPEESFGSGLEDMDETGRNMAYTSYRKISQYVLDAYDSLANPKDKEIFLDYLVTNLKLYFDKFEDELSSSVEEPSTSEYDRVTGS